VFTINGFTEAELDQQRAAQGNPTAGAVATLKIVAERERSAVAVDASVQQSIARQESFGARPSLGGQSPADDIRRARLEEFRNSDAAKIPDLVVQERAAAVEEARGKLAELRGGMVQPGDAAQEQRNDRLLGQVRTLLGEDAPITKALTVLESHAGDRNKMGLVADELRVRYPEHSSLIDQHLGRLDPELASAETQLRNEEHDFQIVKTVAAAVEKGIETGNIPSAAFFDSIAKAVKRA